MFQHGVYPVRHAREMQFLGRFHVFIAHASQRHAPPGKQAFQIGFGLHFYGFDRVNRSSFGSGNPR